MVFGEDFIACENKRALSRINVTGPSFMLFTCRSSPNSFLAKIFSTPYRQSSQPSCHIDVRQSLGSAAPSNPGLRPLRQSPRSVKLLTNKTWPLYILYVSIHFSCIVPGDYPHIVKRFFGHKLSINFGHRASHA